QKLDAAIDAFRNAIERDPKCFVAHMALGNVLVVQKKWDEAATAFRKAVELAPKHAGAHYNLALALHRQGMAQRDQKKLEEAVTHDRTATELGVKDAAVYVSLGALLCDELKDYDKAIECFRTAIKLDPKNANAYRNLIVALTQKGWALVNSPDPKRRDPK